MQKVAQKKLESSFIATMDGLGLQEYNTPSNKAMPKVGNPMNQGPKYNTPVLIPPLKYIVYNNPQQTYDFLINMGYKVQNSIPSTYQFAKIFVRENGDEGIMALVRAAHPDKDIFFKAFDIKEKKESSFEGEKAAETTTTTVVEKADKSEDKPMGIKITPNTVIIILVILLFFILITRR